MYTYGLGLISESSDKSGYLVYHFDQLGSTKRITDKDGKTVYTMSYGSYGELFGIQDAKGNLVNFKDNPIAFLYNGQYGIVTDQNTLTYMRARYYNPEIKRFLNQDVLTGSIGNSQSLNRYSYVQGNPIRFTDPFGLCPDGSGVASPKQIWDYIKDAWKTQKGMSLFSSKEERKAAHREVNARHAEAAATVNRAIDAAKQSYKDMTWQEKAHLWLGVAGFIPVIGVAADFVDGCIYLSEGKVGDALFSIGCAAAGLIVGIDQVSDMMKLARMGSKANKVANVGSLIKVSSNIEDFAGIGREGSFLQDVIKGVGVSGDAADGVRTANHAADGIKGANNAVDATKSASNVGEAVGGGSKTISYTEYDNIYQSSIHNAGKDKVMLGKYDGGGDSSYITKAGTDYEYFSLGGNWDTIKTQYGYTENDMFKLFNESFLDDGINAGKTFQFSHNPVGDTGALGQEFEYLSKNNYLWDETTMTMVPKY